MQKNSFTYKDLIECGKGKLFGEGNAKLTSPPMFMMDRIVKINKDGRTGKVAEEEAAITIFIVLSSLRTKLVSQQLQFLYLMRRF